MIVKKIIKKLIKHCTGCTMLYKTNWYKSLFLDIDHEIFPDNNWYRKHEERNFDVVNLGSSGGKWAFDYSGIDIKGMNWAIQPQTLPEDYQILRHYHSILKKNGTVIVTIMPFTGLNKKTDLMDALKYLKIDTQGEPIEPYLYKKALLFAEFPILFKKAALKALIKYLLKINDKVLERADATLDYNPMNIVQLKQDAEHWINGWKKQFCIEDFNNPLTSENQKGREFRIKVMQDIVDFCTDRGYRVVYVIPPVTKYLDQYFTSTFKNRYYYDYLKAVDRDVLTLDYTADEEFANESLYFNSFFLNARGRKIFTIRVLKDLKIYK